MKNKNKSGSKKRNHRRKQVKKEEEPSSDIENEYTVSFPLYFCILNLDPEGKQFRPLDIVSDFI